MLSKIKPSITFHIIDDILNKPNNFSLELGFYGYKKINLNQKFIIEEKYFPKSRDKFKTNIILNIEIKVINSL